MAFPQQGRWGIYDVTALIGEGGMGQVYRATDTKLDRGVAFKMLPQAFTDEARFEREAKVSGLAGQDAGGMSSCTEGVV